MVESQGSRRKESNTFTASLNKYPSVNTSSSQTIKSAYARHLLYGSYMYGPDTFLKVYFHRNLH
ncbi:hypothetical protein H311_01335 [Anncaliia algerae PRA109]|nr:hypothetical protein H311_01335 [Anncaliia algerae PRA109]